MFKKKLIGKDITLNLNNETFNHKMTHELKEEVLFIEIDLLK